MPVINILLFGRTCFFGNGGYSEGKITLPGCNVYIIYILLREKDRILRGHMHLIIQV